MPQYQLKNGVFINEQREAEYQLAGLFINEPLTGKFAETSFEGANGTLIQTANPLWVKNPTLTGNAQLIDGRMRPSSSTTAFYYYNVAPPTANYTVYVDSYITVGGSNAGAFGVTARMSATANTCYLARYTYVDNRIELFRIVAGTATLLGSLARTLTQSKTYALGLSVIGSTITVLWENKVIISVVDSAITEAGFAGIRSFSSATPLDTFRPQLQRFRVATEIASVTNLIANAIVSYVVRGELKPDYLLTYLINANVSSDRAINYLIKANVTAQSAIDYLVKANASASQVISYLVRANVSKELAADYFVRSNASTSTIVDYLIRTSSTTGFNLEYDILNRMVAESSVSIAYKILGVLQKAYAPTYKVLGSQAVTASYNYKVRSSQDRSLSIAYTVLNAGQVTSNFTVSFNTRTNVLSSGGFSWFIRSIATSSTGLVYTVRANLADQLPIDYKIYTNASSNTALSYRLRSALTDELNLGYSVRDKAENQLAFNYVVFEQLRVQSDLQVLYTILAEIAGEFVDIYVVQRPELDVMVGPNGILDVIVSATSEANIYIPN